MKEMEGQIDEAENELLNKFGDKILYTFVQIQRKNDGMIMAQLKDKSDMDVMWKRLREFCLTLLFDSGWSLGIGELPFPIPQFRSEH